MIKNIKPGSLFALVLTLILDETTAAERFVNVFFAKNNQFITCHGPV
jgi:hypothetical protein